MDLRQGNPLSHFLFVMIIEGLSGMVKKATKMGEFQWFSIQDSFRVELLQFAYDTLIIGEGNWKNVWFIKVILRGFELAS